MPWGGGISPEIHGQNVMAYVDADRESYIVADDGEPEAFASKSFGESWEVTSTTGWGWHENRYFSREIVLRGRSLRPISPTR